jgi:hypothetical protein
VWHFEGVLPRINLLDEYSALRQYQILLFLVGVSVMAKNSSRGLKASERSRRAIRLAREAGMVLRNFRRAAFCGEKNPARRLLQRGMSYNYLASILVEGGREWRERESRKKRMRERPLWLCVFSFAAVSGAAPSLTLVLLFRLPPSNHASISHTLFICSAEMEKKTRISSQSKRARFKNVSLIYFIPN